MAGLSPVPQMRLSFELSGLGQDRRVFREDAHPTRDYRFAAERRTASETQIDGEVGRWDACRDKAVDWLGRQLAAAAAAIRPRRRRMTCSGPSSWPRRNSRPWRNGPACATTSSRNSTRLTRRRIARHVLRAAHLDPTSEPAAYLAACYVDALYPREGKDADELSLAAIDRAMIEAQRYLDRFPQRNVEHHLAMFFHAGLLGVKGAWKLAGGPGRKDDILRPPDVRQYPYVSFYVRAWAEHGYLGNVDKRYDNGNSFSAFSFNLVNRLVPCIPDDKLDEEYEYWRTFYATKVAKILRSRDLQDFLNTRPAPWDLVDAAFQARKKNPQGVRQAFQRLAERVSAQPDARVGRRPMDPASGTPVLEGGRRSRLADVAA